MRQPTEDDIANAGVVLKAVKQIDPYFINADMSIARGWAQVFVRHDYSLQEMLDGVVDFYTHETRGRHCMPANVIEGARRARERLAATDPGYRAALEERRAKRVEKRDKEIAQRAATQPEITHKPNPAVKKAIQQLTERKKL